MTPGHQAVLGAPLSLSDLPRIGGPPHRPGAGVHGVSAWLGEDKEIGYPMRGRSHRAVLPDLKRHATTIGWTPPRTIALGAFGGDGAHSGRLLRAGTALTAG